MTARIPRDPRDVSPYLLRPLRTEAEVAELRARVAAARGIVGDGDVGSAGQEGEAQ